VNNSIKFFDASTLSNNFKLDVKKIEDEILEQKQRFNLHLEGITLKATTPKAASLYNEVSIPTIWSKNHIEYWLPKAKKGDSNAMLQIGLIHDRDNNYYRPKSFNYDDNLEALKWYQKAVGAGSEIAKKRLVFLKNWMKHNGY
jgi:TPR repeat protein